MNQLSAEEGTSNSHLGISCPLPFTNPYLLGWYAANISSHAQIYFIIASHINSVCMNCCRKNIAKVELKELQIEHEYIYSYEELSTKFLKQPDKYCNRCQKCLFEIDYM